MLKKQKTQGAAATLWQQDVPNPPTNIPIIIVENTEVALQELARAYRTAIECKGYWCYRK